MAHVFQINISKGGVPKLPIHNAEVTELGIIGDRQTHADFHGGPDRAVCIYSLERITSLQEEGHPIFPGSTGENLTLAGLDWNDIQAGIQISIGNDVLLEITRHTVPCKTIRPSFLENDSNRIHEEKHKGWSRFYAKVLRTGNISIGIWLNSFDFFSACFIFVVLK